MTEFGQKKILKCLADGLKTLHNIIGGQLKSERATELLFNNIDCNAAKPQVQVQNGGNNKNQVSHSKPRPGPPPAGRNNGQNHVTNGNPRSSRAIGNMGGENAHDAHHRHVISRSHNQRTNHSNKTLDAIQQVSEHSKDEAVKNRPRVRNNRRPGRRREKRLAQQQNEMNEKAWDDFKLQKATEARVNAELKNQRSMHTTVQQEK